MFDHTLVESRIQTSSQPADFVSTHKPNLPHPAPKDTFPSPQRIVPSLVLLVIQTSPPPPPSPHQRPSNVVHLYVGASCRDLGDRRGAGDFLSDSRDCSLGGRAWDGRKRGGGGRWRKGEGRGEGNRCSSLKRRTVCGVGEGEYRCIYE